MPRRYHVRVSTAAQQDLYEIQLYIAPDAPGRAAEFTERLLERLYSLEHFPERHPLSADTRDTLFPTRCMSYPPYRVAYSVTGDVVEIHRVFHSARNVEG